MEDNHKGVTHENEFHCECPVGYGGGLCQVVGSSQGIVGDTTRDETTNSSSSKSSGRNTGIAIMIHVVTAMFATIL